MARTSRKNLSESMQTIPPQRIYKTCLYLRLSKEDSGYENHDSIEMQEYLLEQFIKTQPDMEIVAVFCDNGATGTNFDRPDFERMMDAVRRREVDCIVVKDLSRFGRNYVETGYYLEKIFPFLGVRFVAVNDSYDTLKGKSTDEMIVSLKNIVNSLFAKDISKKSGSALRRKQENGEFIGSWTPYGYQKSPENKHQLMIDPATAPVVKNIFEWRLEGLGYGEIAKRLNCLNIQSPTLTRYLRGEFTKEAPQTMSRLWIATTIKNITNNMVYAGHMAQGKQVRSLCDGIPNTEVDRQDWIIVRETHEPIVTEDIWNAVSQINQAAYNQATQKRKLPQTENMLVGLVFCKDCGKTMARLKNCSLKGHIRYTYNCRIRKASKGASGCTNKNIGELELLDIILDSVHLQISATVKKVFRKYQGIQHITREMAVELIHHITIEGRCDVHIFWNFKDEYETLLSHTMEVRT